MIYRCCNENRKAAVLENATLNGIDFLEVLDHDAIALNSPRQRTLLVHCLKAAPAGLTPEQRPDHGRRKHLQHRHRMGIARDRAPAVADQCAGTGLFHVPRRRRQHAPGAHLAWRAISLRTTSGWSTAPRRRTRSVRSYRGPRPASIRSSPPCSSLSKWNAGPISTALRHLPLAAPTLPAPPPINYLAKDYGSFRTLILDRFSQLLPAWAGTSEADLGVALAELIAYVGDHFSYQQDAVSTEAYLETARSRISLRRHALLVDYHVHDGANARAWIQLQAAGNPGDQIFLDRSRTRFYTFAPGMPSNLAFDSGNEEAALRAGVEVFEPMWDAALYPEHNQMCFYTWGDTSCCLPQGATEATLAGSLPNLHPGDVLIFQEIIGPQTGNPADADIRHRHAVRLTGVATHDGSGEPLEDPLFLDAGGQPLPVTEINWSEEDALPFPICISSTYLDASGNEQTVSDVSVAFGNVVLADHGLSMPGKDLGLVPEPRIFFPAGTDRDHCDVSPRKAVPPRFRPHVPDSPLTQAVPFDAVSLPAVGNPVTSAPVLLGPSGFAGLKDSGGDECLQLQATNASGWPALFGVVVTANTVNPANLDLAVVYNPAGGAAGIQMQVVVEQFTDLSLNTADPNYAATAINSASQLILVPASYVPRPPPPPAFRRPPPCSPIRDR